METKEMIRAILNKKECTQEELAKMLNVNKAQITRWLDDAIPSFENRFKILELYYKLF